MYTKLIDSKHPLTVKDLLDILKNIPEPQNVLIGIESENSIWELQYITQNSINYRDVVILHPADKGISRPDDVFRD